MCIQNIISAQHYMLRRSLLLCVCLSLSKEEEGFTFCVVVPPIYTAVAVIYECESLQESILHLP